MQRAAAAVWDKDLTFREAVDEDPEITEALTPEQIDAALSLERSLRNVPAVFERVGIEAREDALVR